MKMNEYISHKYSNNFSHNSDVKTNKLMDLQISFHFPFVTSFLQLMKVSVVFIGPIVRIFRVK